MASHAETRASWRRPAPRSPAPRRAGRPPGLRLTFRDASAGRLRGPRPPDSRVRPRRTATSGAAEGAIRTGGKKMSPRPPRPPGRRPRRGRPGEGGRWGTLPAPGGTLSAGGSSPLPQEGGTMGTRGTIFCTPVLNRPAPPPTRTQTGSPECHWRCRRQGKSGAIPWSIARSWHRLPLAGSPPRASRPRGPGASSAWGEPAGRRGASSRWRPPETSGGPACGLAAGVGVPRRSCLWPA